MASIGDFLQKFKKLDEDSRARRSGFVETVSKIVGFPVKPEFLKVKDGVLHVKGSPTLRMELFMQKQAILEALKDRGVIDMR